MPSTRREFLSQAALAVAWIAAGRRPLPRTPEASFEDDLIYQRTESANAHDSDRSDHIRSLTQGHGPVLAFVNRAVASRWGIMAAIATYFAMAIVIGIQIPGLQFDEAIFQHGGIHILKSADAPPFPYNQGTWIKIAGRYIPLMVLPYIGSVTFFLHALPFSVFGATAATARTVNLLMGAVGIWGVGRFAQSWIGLRLGTALAFVLAIHPGYLTWTMYDNAGIAIWMAALGIVCFAAVRYIERFDPWSAFLLGVCLGFAVWCRANYVWLFTGVLLALAIVLRRELLSTIRHWPVLVAGGAVGSLPLIVYQIASHLGTFQFMQAASGGASLLQLVPPRLAMGAQTLVDVSGRRRIWGGPDPAGWQVLLLGLLLVISVVTCLLATVKNASRGKVYRVSALALVFTIGLTLTSPVRLGPHHFIVYLPLAAFVVLAALQVVRSRWRAARFLVLTVGVGYAAVALSWDIRTAVGMRQTGGLGMWSDGVFAVADTIETKHRGKTINVLDWGLTNNLYVLTSGGFRPRELYWGGTSERTGLGTTWPEEISRGGLYLLSGQSNAFKKDVGEAFRQAVEESGLSYTKAEFRQKNGQIYAQLYEISTRPKAGERAHVRSQTESTNRRILQLFPSTAVVGRAFNKQPDGSSAMAIQGEGFSRDDRVFWNGRELVTTFGTSELLSALVPEALLRKPGVVNVSVRDVFHPGMTELSATLKIER